MENIVCFGDSNTFGYSGDLSEKKGRFNTEQRWPSLLQKELGEIFSVIEEGSNGRTIQFSDKNQPGLCGIESIPAILETHKPVSLLIIMLGSNDCQERFASTPEEIALGLKKLIKIAHLESSMSNGTILIVAPPSMQQGLYNGPFSSLMGEKAVEKSSCLAAFFQKVAMEENCLFLDANTHEMNQKGINQVDYLHLNLLGHKFLSKELASLIRELQK